MSWISRVSWPLVMAISIHGAAVAQETGGGIPQVSSTGDQDQVLHYPAEFFSRYRPRTALDIVRQLPGFLLDDGDSTRGFGAAAGNILINGRRPSAKQDSPSSFLTRIAASQVAGVELIRGQVRGIDLLGHSSLANIILRSDLPAVVRWESSIRHNNRGPIKPGLDISLTDSWGNIEYTAGLFVEAEANGEDGERSLFDGNGNLEERISVDQESKGIQVEGTFNALTWLGETLVNANTKISSDSRNPKQHAVIIPQPPAADPRQEFIEDDLVIKGVEVGLDAVRELNQNLLGKGILLFYHKNIPKISTRQLLDASGAQTLSRAADTDTDTTEAIARLEFNWSGLPGHTLQLNLEGAYNEVDGSLIQTDDTGAGPVLVDVPGSNTKVDEVRWDFLLKDNWSLGRYELDYGLGVEFSTISTTGDSEQERSFTFLKPAASLIYSAGRDRQVRFRLVREISQLDFNDFISTTVFDDNDVALGNPDLRPDATWVTELSYERRFGRTAVVKLLGFHHWIDEVLDLLPLTATNAVPGNIGNGRRWGAEFEGTVPLDRLGLTGSKLSFTMRWQDSAVTDPVTGETRVLSAQGGNTAYRSPMTGNRNNRYFLRLDYRQDFEAERLAWGWTVAEREHRPLFKADELDLYGEGLAVDAFVETTRWRGLKVQLLGENLLDFKEWRERMVFDGERGLSPVKFLERRDRQNGRKITLSLSGSF